MRNADKFEEWTWTCEDCGATVEPVPIGDEYVPKGFCNCPDGQTKKEEHLSKDYLHEAQRNRWIGESRLDKRLTLNNYPGYNKAKALKWVSGYQRGLKGWLFVHGPVGTHKHHLINAIGLLVIQAVTEDPRVFYLDWGGFEREMRLSWDDRERGSDCPFMFRRAQKCKLLIINGVDNVSRNVWGIRQFVDLLSYRHRGNYPTVMSSSRPFGKGSSSLKRAFTGGNVDMQAYFEQWGVIFKQQILRSKNGKHIYTGAIRRSS